jgi:hypothetical protein
MCAGLSPAPTCKLLVKCRLHSLHKELFSLAILKKEFFSLFKNLTTNKKERTQERRAFLSILLVEHFVFSPLCKSNGEDLINRDLMAHLVHVFPNQY